MFTSWIKWRSHTTINDEIGLITSIQVGLHWSRKCVRSEISWDRSRSEKALTNCSPSLLVSPSVHQDWDWALKSPANNITKGFSILIFNTRFSKLVIKSENSRVSALMIGLRYKTVKNIFYEQTSFQLQCIHSMWSHSWVQILSVFSSAEELYVLLWSQRWGGGGGKCAKNLYPVYF